MKEKDPVVIAILTADLHFCHTPPIARSPEKDWYGAMGRQIIQLTKLANRHESPIIIAGDIFDKFKQPSCELVNFILDVFRPRKGIYAVAGNHDLPNHNYDDLSKSSLYTLVKAGTVTLLEPNKPVEIEGPYPLRLHGFSHGYNVKPLKNPHDLFVEVAVVHDMIWNKNDNTQYAPEDKHVSKFEKYLVGYDVALFGDNHNPFSAKVGKCRVWNAGGFFRRRINEINHKPSVGLLYSDGTVDREFIDCSEDKFSEDRVLHKSAEAGIRVEGVLDCLSSLSDVNIDFREAIRHAIDEMGLSNGVRDVLLGAMETEK